MIKYLIWNDILESLKSKASSYTENSSWIERLAALFRTVFAKKRKQWQSNDSLSRWRPFYESLNSRGPKKTGRPEKKYFPKFQRFHKFLQNFRIFFLIWAFVFWKVWKPQTQEKNNLVEIVAYEIIGKTLCKVSYLATKSTKVLKLSNQTVACQSSLMARQTSTFSLGM